MPVKAYLLIQCHMGKTRQVVCALKTCEGIVSVDVVSGSWDAIAVVKGATVGDIGELVVSKVRRIDGIDKTLTCLVV